MVRRGGSIPPARGAANTSQKHNCPRGQLAGAVVRRLRARSKDRSRANHARVYGHFHAAVLLHVGGCFVL